MPVSLSALLAALSALFVSQLAFSDTYPVTVQDDRNEHIVFERKPESVASVSVFGADLLAALGKKAAGLSTLNHKQSAFLGDRVKGMVDLGEIHETNMELLTELDPDLTIGIRAYTEPFAKKFEEIGKFLAYDMVTYEDSVRAINSAATALGEQRQAHRLNSAFAERLKAYSEKAPGGFTVVFLWHWADVPYGYYNHHLTMRIMRALKAENLVGPSPKPKIKKLDSAPVSMESLLKLDPDIIVSFKGDDGPIQNHPVWHKLKAVKNGRAYRVGDQYVMPHGPIARDMVLRELAYLFYPQQFAKPKDIPAPAQARLMSFTDD